ncbi:hypothetical protein AO501_09820 [Mycobacterium gordonae]|uniref:Uncharacterized protein n=1 Tax=Mycobacterium gordonae TaxID=1778 RepID=A0A0Q2U6N2_MYCGO|nr:hypothetical protein [Mycobacterium gordonae]KQH76368.1 hypothetical protein AO501_09820 [Mycobacterium gordonae]
MKISARFHATQVRNASKALDVALPSALVVKLDQADQIATTTETMLGTRGDLNAAILDAIERGDDYHDDPLVRRYALDWQIANFQGHGVQEAATERAMQRRRDALNAHANQVLAAWAAALKPHSANLAAAAAGLPNHRLDDAGAVIAAGLEAVELWQGAQRAVKAWGAATAGFVAFASAARVATDDYRWLIFTDAEVPSAGRHVDAWSLACLGHALALPTLKEFQERVAAALPADDLGVDGGLDEFDVA